MKHNCRILPLRCSFECDKEINAQSVKMQDLLEEASVGKMCRLEPGICKTKEGVAKNGKDGETDPVEMEVMQRCTRNNFFFRIYHLNYCSSFVYRTSPESQCARCTTTITGNPRTR